MSDLAAVLTCSAQHHHWVCRLTDEAAISLGFVLLTLWLLLLFGLALGLDRSDPRRVTSLVSRCDPTNHKEEPDG